MIALLTAHGSLQVASGDVSKAHASASLCKIVQDRIERNLGSYHGACQMVMAANVRSLHRAGHLLSAKQLGSSLQQLQANPPPEVVPEVIENLVELAAVCRGLHRPAEEVEELLVAAARLGEDVLGDLTHPWCASTLLALGELAQEGGHHGDAAAWLMQVCPDPSF